MVKISEEGFYDDGFVYLFDKNNLETIFKPTHIRYWIQTNNESKEFETCDFRLSTYELHVAPPKEKTQEVAVEGSPKGPPGYDKKEEGDFDVALVRFGYFEYIKLNTNSMVMNFEPEEWYRVDLIIDWEEQHITIRT